MDCQEEERMAMVVEVAMAQVKVMEEKVEAGMEEGLVVRKVMLAAERTPIAVPPPAGRRLASSSTSARPHSPPHSAAT